MISVARRRGVSGRETPSRPGIFCAASDIAHVPHLISALHIQYVGRLPTLSLGESEEEEAVDLNSLIKDIP